jgi:hypothetical protein
MVASTIPTNQVASNKLNDNYAGMNLMYLCCIIVEGNLGKNSLSQNLTFKVILLCVLNAFIGMIYHLVW